jgi:hypothetical protein
VRAFLDKSELDRADFAVLLYWLSSEVRYGRPVAGRIATDILDHPHREEIVRVVNLGIMDVDSTLHRFSPAAPMRHGAAVRTLGRMLVGFGRDLACAHEENPPTACSAATRCQLVEDEEGCESTETVTGEDAVELIRRALHLLGGA